ncbi:phosphoglycerate mutase-like protein [Hortaea werneckii]|nr:phosphoglycerate mutase-like protein [Hortaea werneckii]KAI7022260.1 phosphoglycerate mutase-like protein [Hortaea werneckii]KAI7151641.1 phosphoglycerate mutase-like protein [Hortaea werneckii]KAI7543613.1 phosphoglycerate mutase-like protein [Hortaea werneckii]KAI7666973.1 phosphoglycerate mutase-like protein [Hortaea werneckii]
MPDKDASTPRVFLIRHGETEWSMSGQYTGKTDIPLTAHGEEQVASTAKFMYGPGRLIDPAKVAKVFVSPRKRAVRTYELLSGSNEGFETTESLAEWDYGQYEGMKTKAIRELRKSHGLDQDREWDIWRDGCEDGETSAQVTHRIDALIAQIKHLQAPHMTDSEPKDIILVAHGHLTRAFAKRWLGYELSFPLSLMMEPGGVGVLSYQHHNVEEPALSLGIGFPVGS